MILTNGEKTAVKQVLEAGSTYGYGNMIAYLKQAWAENLMNDYGFDEALALSAADTTAYKPKAKINIK